MVFIDRVTKSITTLNAMREILLRASRLLKKVQNLRQVERLRLKDGCLLLGP